MEYICISSNANEFNLETVTKGRMVILENSYV